MKKIILAIMLMIGSGCLVADEVNIKVASYVKHHFNVDGLTWNEGFKNSAKGIEFIKDIDENHGIGVTYITFRNSFDIRTNAGGLVYKYTSSSTYFDIRPNLKIYGLYQKGYYGSWNNVKPYDINGDDKFFTPMFSTGFEYKGFTIDAVGTPSTLHAVAFGYSFKL